MKIEKTYEIDEYVLSLFHFLHCIYNGIGDGLPIKIHDELKKILDLVSYELEKSQLKNDIINETYYKKIIYKGDISENI